MGVVALDALAQAADVHVHGARLDIDVVSPHQVEDLRAAEHPVGRLDEEFQQFELAQAQPDRRASQRHFVRVVVDAQPAAFVALLRLRRRRPVGAPQHRLDARHEFARAERLGDVIVRAHLQAEHLVHLRGARGQDQDGHAARGVVGAQQAAHLQTRQPGEHDVENDERRPLPGRQVEADLAVAGLDHGEPFGFQVVADEVANILFVFDDQDFPSGVRPGPLRTRCRHTSVPSSCRSSAVSQRCRPTRCRSPRFPRRLDADCLRPISAGATRAGCSFPSPSR